MWWWSVPEIEWLVEGPPLPTPIVPTAPAGAVVPVETYRDTQRLSGPTWLQTGQNEKLMYAFGVHMDGFVDALVAAVKMRFAGYYSAESLPTIGRERRIRRGRSESDGVYAVRLRRWLDDHPRRGGPYAMLAQLFAHYAPDNFRIDLVYKSQRRFSMDNAGDVVRDDLGTGTSTEAAWAYWTLFYFWPVLPSPATVYWGDVGRTWGDGFVWGSSLTVNEVVDLRLIPREWNAAHCFGEICLLTADVLLWGYPEHTWGEVGLLWGSAEPVRLSVE